MSLLSVNDGLVDKTADLQSGDTSLNPALTKVCSQDFQIVKWSLSVTVVAT